jgi:phage shock protein C
MSCRYDRWEDRRRRREAREERRRERHEERRAGHRRDFLERPYNPHRIYRDRTNRKLTGLCAGIAAYFGVDPLFPRIAMLAAAFFFPFPVIPAYFIVSAFLPKRPPQLYRSAEEETLWREVTLAPDRSFYALKMKFRDLESRLGRLESEVVSGDAELRRKFRDLGV